MGTTNSTYQRNTVVNESIQKSYNNVQYNNELICKSSCVNINSDVYITIENSNVGNINFNQQCSSQVSCVQQYDIDTLNALQYSYKNFETYQYDKQTDSSFTFNLPTFIGFSYTKIQTNVSNYSYNSVYNTTNINIKVSCESSALNQQTGTFLIIKNSNSGDINFIQEGNVYSSCISVNSNKISGNEQLENKSTLVETESGSLQWGLIIGIIFLVILIIVVIITIVVIVNQNKKSKDENVEKTVPKLILYETNEEIVEI